MGSWSYSYPHSFMLPMSIFALLGSLFWGLSSEWTIVLAFRELQRVADLYSGELVDYLPNLDLQTAVPTLEITLMAFITHLRSASARNRLGKAPNLNDR